MLNGNGHTNGNGKPNGKVFSSTSSIAGTPNYSEGAGIDPTNPREVRLLCRSITRGWLKELGDPAKMAKAYADLEEAIEHCAKGGQVHTMAAAAKAKLLVDVVTLGIRLAEFEDKADRLDSGQATENHVVFDVRMPDARNRIGE